MQVDKKNIDQKKAVRRPKSQRTELNTQKKSVNTLIEIRDLAQSHSKAALNRIVSLTGSSTPSVALAACREILDRAYGKPVQATEISGKHGRAVAIDITAITERLNARLGPARDERVIPINNDGDP